MLIGFSSSKKVSPQANPEMLSGFGFFKKPMRALLPEEGVIPYTLATPLFSNYAEKARFIKIPKGQAAAYNPDEVFELPEGTYLIKNFYYPADFREPQKGKRILETRVMYKDAEGWQTWPYIWKEDQTDAEYDPTGDNISVSYINTNGKKVTTQYLVPNKNQCKGCHLQHNEVVPIGIAARHLNSKHDYGKGEANQLRYWEAQGVLQGLPDGNLPVSINWLDNTYSVDQRARAYLDINCGHCHRPDGAANTSGLFLHAHENNPTALGIMKTPIAAGRGSGNRKFDIVPGKPDASILLFRMQTNDPGIAMPELGREQLHTEGIALIKEWIKQMQ
jgi:uncharacterized repeat protein (TIGR03806 family)